MEEERLVVSIFRNGAGDLDGLQTTFSASLFIVQITAELVTFTLSSERDTDQGDV
jgi:hypothetical protein